MTIFKKLKNNNQKSAIINNIQWFFYFESVLDCIYKENPVLFNLDSLDIWWSVQLMIDLIFYYIMPINSTPLYIL